MKATLESYLVAIGFDVQFVVKQPVNVRDDVAVARFARKHRRVLVTHDRFKDGKTKVRLFQELATKGGKALQIHGGGQQPVLTSLGKILVRRTQWVQWFKENRDGLVRLSLEDMKSFNREHLSRQVQARLDLAVPPVEVPTPRHRRSTKRSSPQPPGQGSLDLQDGVSSI